MYSMYDAFTDKLLYFLFQCRWNSWQGWLCPTTKSDVRTKLPNLIGYIILILKHDDHVLFPHSFLWLYDQVCFIFISERLNSNCLYDFFSCAIHHSESGKLGNSHSVQQSVRRAPNRNLITAKASNSQCWVSKENDVCEFIKIFKCSMMIYVIFNMVFSKV